MATTQRTTRKTPAKPKVEAKATPEVQTTTSNRIIVPRAERTPTQLHEDFSRHITEETGVEVTPQAVMLVLGMHGDFQKSPERRKARAQAASRRAAEAKKSLAARRAKLEEKLSKMQKEAQEAQEAQEA